MKYYLCRLHYKLMLGTFFSGTLLLASCSIQNNIALSPPPSKSAAVKQVNLLADKYMATKIKYHPLDVYAAGLSLDVHDGFTDNSPKGIAEQKNIEDELYRQLKKIDEALLLGEPAWRTHGMLMEALEANIEKRVCRQELWNIGFMSGWQVVIAELATKQPLKTSDQEQQALLRWEKIAQYIDQEILHLQQGLDNGYSAARPVAQRVAQQLDALLANPLEETPFNPLLQANASAKYQIKMRDLLQSRLLVSIKAYRDFLKDHYLLSARKDLAISANPDGAACYKALLRFHTSLKIQPEKVYQLGQSTVDTYSTEVAALGKKFYGTTDFASTTAHVSDLETDRFSSKDEVLSFARQVIERAGEEVNNWFGASPKSAVVVKPIPDYLEGTGLSAGYEGPTEDKPGIYWIPLYQPEKQSRGRVEITALHEAYPGHHLQFATALELRQAHEITKLIYNSGYDEGWGRYSERLAEEMGLYSTQTALILRRAWPARGMVVDPGIHVYGWTRQQAADYIMAAGSFNTETAEALVDRIADIPGQMTSYDTGGLEILALRQMAKRELGNQFDIRAFHDQVLLNGSITLPMLRSQVVSWIESQKISADNTP